MKGSIVDAWSHYPEIVLWIKDFDGNNLFLKDYYPIKSFIQCKTPKGKEIFRNQLQNKIFRLLGKENKIEVWSGEVLEVFAVEILEQASYRKIVQSADRNENEIDYYNTDLGHVHLYFIAKNLFPLAEVDFDVLDDRIVEINSLSDRLALELKPLPPLRKLSFYAECGKYVPLGEKNPLVVLAEDSQTFHLAGRHENIISELNEILDKYDPDIIYTENGDEFIFPNLFQWSYKYNIRLQLDREPQVYFRKNTVKKRSVYIYGQMIYKTTPFPLFGRIHIDKGQSFFFKETELEGILEMSRLSRLSIQQLGRSTPGTSMSAIEDECALAMGYLIPRIKGSATEIKTLADLLKSDQGGISYRPPMGNFEDVAEIDFRALYPNLMRKYNISGETINCKCCKGHGIKVPGLKYHTCRIRKGIVGVAISQLLDRRDQIKDLLETELSENYRERFELKASALKWCLVTSFGYTGYKNAKYGKREAHEAITAWGRYSLLVAKEIAESMNFTLLHALTDSLWLQPESKEFLSDESIKNLCDKINQITGLHIIHEATYSWICFPESNIYKDQATATRYFARDIKGKVKVRGMLSRKRDTPEIVNNFQRDLYDLLSKCETIKAVESQYSDFFQLRDSYIKRIRLGKVTPEELTIYRRVTRKPEEYVANNASKIVSESLSKQSEIVGGETISYIVLNRKAKDPSYRYIPSFTFSGSGYDKEFYSEFIKRAFLETIGNFISGEFKLDL